MGRIYDALRRSNIDPVAGTAAPPAPPSWLFEQHEETVVEAATRSAGGLIVAAPPGGPVAGDDGRLVVSGTAGPLLVEQFRSLAAKLHRAKRERPLKSLIVTSASPGDGKSHVAVNLALTLGVSYRRRVLLIDADVRRPSLHMLFGVRNTGGLGEALEVRAEAKLAAVKINETLTLLPAGRANAGLLGDLSSDRMKHLVEDAASRFDWVIVDTPPVGVLADGRLISETVDVAILVVRAGVTRFADLEAAAATLGPERVVGIVLNAVDPAEIRGKDYYHRYHGYYGYSGRESANG